MAVLGNKFIDLIDIYKGQDGKGNDVDIIEMLHQMNPILQDAQMTECNNNDRHDHSVRTGLPQVAWGKMYKGVVQSKSNKASVSDTTGFVESLSTVDTRILEKAKDGGKRIRLEEAMSHLEAMEQEVSSKIFYGNDATAPEEFLGLTPRFNDPDAPNGKQIVNGGGVGSDNTSIWFIGWGPSQCQLLYSEGTQAGFQRMDKGEQRTTDENGDVYYVKEEMFRWNVGLAVKDWRYVSRICNLDVSDVQDGAVDLYALMRKAYYKLWKRRIPEGQCAIYLNRDMIEALDALATNGGTSDNFVRLGRKEVEGEEILTYRGIPLRESDALINSEELVTGF